VNIFYCIKGIKNIIYYKLMKKDQIILVTVVALHLIYIKRSSLQNLLEPLLKYFKKDEIKILTPEEKYIEQKKERFLLTYEKEKDFNTNINEVIYDKKSLKKSLELENNDLEKEWKRRILYETTPRGNLIMYYDPYKLGFTYYSDTSLPYNILNAVAMKYCIIYYCRELFIDTTITPDDKKSKMIDEHYIEKPSEKKKSLIQSNKTAFTRFKNYKQKEESQDKKENKEKKKEDYYNRFIHMGKVINIELIQKQKKVNKLNGFNSVHMDNLKQETDLQKHVINFKNFKKRKIS